MKIKNRIFNSGKTLENSINSAIEENIKFATAIILLIISVINVLTVSLRKNPAIDAAISVPTKIAIVVKATILNLFKYF